MAQYQTLVPMILPSGLYIEAGTTITDTGPSPDIPTTWIPPLGVSPIDADAIQKFWNVGPPAAAFMPLVRQIWSGTAVAAPSVYWKQIAGTNNWQLTGAGASLGVR